MVLSSKTEEELLVERKAVLLTTKVDENKAQQVLIIANCANQISELEVQISKLKGMKADALDLLAELEERYPAVPVEEK